MKKNILELLIEKLEEIEKMHTETEMQDCEINIKGSKEDIQFEAKGRVSDIITALSEAISLVVFDNYEDEDYDDIVKSIAGMIRISIKMRKEDNKNEK